MTRLNGFRIHTPSPLFSSAFRFPLMTYVRRVCLLLGLSLLSVSAAVGQSPSPEETGVQYWVHAGPAATTLGLGASGGVAVEFARHVFSLRGTSTDPTPNGETWDVALLYGRATTPGAFFLSAGTGVSIVGGTQYSHLFGRDEGEDFEPMIGFPLEGRLAWSPPGPVAFGLYAFANVNTAHPLGGLGLTLHLGRLR